MNPGGMFHTGFFFLTVTTLKHHCGKRGIRCAAIKLRAERKAGEILADMKPNPGKPKSLHDERISKPRLKDIGITEVQSHRWQAVAIIPELA